MEEFKIENVSDFNNYVVVNINGIRVLIDTGSPLSLGKINEIEILGNIHPITRNLNNLLNMDELSRYVGNVDAIIGADILNNICYEINLSEGIFRVSNEPIVPINGFSLSVNYLNGIPIIQCVIDGNNEQAIFDTGAPISYISEEIANRYNPIGEMEDYHPMFGKFNTKIYEIPVEINGITDNFRFGVLPEQLREALRILGNINNILGFEYLKRFTASISREPDLFMGKEC